MMVLTFLCEHSKALSFLPMENLRFTEESHLRALLRDASNQSTPFALKISAVLAFGTMLLLLLLLVFYRQRH